MSKLLPCPFCGGKHIIQTYIDFKPALKCDCGAYFVANESVMKSLDDLEKVWNTRKGGK